MEGALGIGVGRPVLTYVALVISQPVLAMTVQEALNQCQEVEVRLATGRVAALAALAGRERVHVVIGEPLAAEELRVALHPGQRLVLLARGGTSPARPGEAVVDMAAPGWPTALAALVRAASPGTRAATERRQGASAAGHRQLVAWAQRQPGGDAAAFGRALGALPGLGQPTGIAFLGLHRLVPRAGDGAALARAIGARLREGDGIFRLDERTVALLVPVAEPAALVSLITRLSWQMCPEEPAALAAGLGLWRPGEAAEAAAEAAWARLLAAWAPGGRCGPLREGEETAG